MSKTIEASEDGIKDAYETGCSDIRRTLKTVFPDAFKTEATCFSCGTRVKILGSANEHMGVVLGNSDDDGVRAFYRVQRPYTTLPKGKTVALATNGNLYYNDNAFTFEKEDPC